MMRKFFCFARRQVGGNAGRDSFKISNGFSLKKYWISSKILVNRPRRGAKHQGGFF